MNKKALLKGVCLVLVPPVGIILVINSKKKGKVGELEIANILKNEYGLNARRGQQFSGSPDSPDVICEEMSDINIEVSEKMFFNGMLKHFNEIYKEIEPLIENIENTVVLFPVIKNKEFEKMDNNSAINLIARTAYFNNYNDGIIQREVSFREIPKSQQEKEIIEYCKTHENPNISDIVYDLQLQLFDVDDILTELEEKGIEMNVKY